MIAFTILVAACVIGAAVLIAAAMVTQAVEAHTVSTFRPRDELAERRRAPEQGT